MEDGIRTKDTPEMFVHLLYLIVISLPMLTRSAGAKSPANAAPDSSMLSHLPQDKMVDISQMASSNAFS